MPGVKASAYVYSRQLLTHVYNEMMWLCFQLTRVRTRHMLFIGQCGAEYAQLSVQGLQAVGVGAIQAVQAPFLVVTYSCK